MCCQETKPKSSDQSVRDNVTSKIYTINSTFNTVVVRYHFRIASFILVRNASGVFNFPLQNKVSNKFSGILISINNKKQENNERIESP